MTPLQESFVFHCGEMGSRWGFNRTVGQIFALIVISPQALTANDLADALNISRGNVSMALKELSAWRLVKTSYKKGDRKDYYEAAGTIWELANKVFEERKRREIDPTLTMLRDLMLSPSTNTQEQHAQTKITEIHDLLENITRWTESLQELTPEQLNGLMKLGSSVSKVLDFKGKFLNKNNNIEN